MPSAAIVLEPHSVCAENLDFFNVPAIVVPGGPLNRLLIGGHLAEYVPTARGLTEALVWLYSEDNGSCTEADKAS
jgi:hypothetical protein